MPYKILFKGSFNLSLKNFTTTPVNRAEIIVPSLIPTIVKSKNNRDKIIDMITQKISNTIFTFPNFLWNISEIAFTNASPEFIITFAIIESEIPKPRITIPAITITIHIGYVFAEINDTIHIPKSVNQPKKTKEFVITVLIENFCEV